MHERPLYVALDGLDAKRDTTTRERIFAIPDDPGPAHALDVASTYTGDPWRTHGVGGRLTSPEPHFYGVRGPSASCGAMMRVVLPIRFNPDNADVCPECATRVSEGRAFRADPCRGGAADADGAPYECTLREDHSGPHRDSVNYATWARGSHKATREPFRLY